MLFEDTAHTFGLASILEVRMFRRKISRKDHQLNLSALLRVRVRLGNDRGVHFALYTTGVGVHFIGIEGIGGKSTMCR
jgi:hypothetical protein